MEVSITVASGGNPIFHLLFPRLVNPDTTTHHVLTATREFLDQAERAAAYAVPTNVEEGIAVHTIMVRSLRQLIAATRWEAAEIGNYGELLTVIGNYEDRMAALETQLANQRRTSDRLALLAVGESPPKTESIPDPIPFGGTRTAHRPFLNQLRNKIQGNPTKFPDAQHDMRYAFGFLKGAAYDGMEPHIQDHGIAF